MRKETGNPGQLKTYLIRSNRLKLLRILAQVKLGYKMSDPIMNHGN